MGNATNSLKWIICAFEEQMSVSYVPILFVGNTEKILHVTMLAHEMLKDSSDRQAVFLCFSLS